MKEPLIPVAEALARVLASAAEPLGRGRGSRSQDAFGRTLSRDLDRRRARSRRSPIPRWTATPCAPPTPPRRRRACELIGESAAGRAFAGASAPARPCASSPARRSRRAPTRSRCRRTRGASGDAHRPFRQRGDGRQCARRRHRLRRRRSRCCRRDAPRPRRASRSPPPRIIARLLVRRRPRVAILATGDELVAPGEPIGPAQIVASNNFYHLAGLVEASGGAPIDLGIARDAPEALARQDPAARDGSRPTCW